MLLFHFAKLLIQVRQYLSKRYSHNHLTIQISATSHYVYVLCLFFLQFPHHYFQQRLHERFTISHICWKYVAWFEQKVIKWKQKGKHMLYKTTITHCLVKSENNLTHVGTITLFPQSYSIIQKDHIEYFLIYNSLQGIFNAWATS